MHLEGISMDEKKIDLISYLRILEKEHLNNLGSFQIHTVTHSAIEGQFIPNTTHSGQKDAYQGALALTLSALQRDLKDAVTLTETESFTISMNNHNNIDAVLNEYATKITDYQKDFIQNLMLLLTHTIPENFCGTLKSVIDPTIFNAASTTPALQIDQLQSIAKTQLELNKTTHKLDAVEENILKSIRDLNLKSLQALTVQTVLLSTLQSLFSDPFWKDHDGKPIKQIKTILENNHLPNENKTIQIDHIANLKTTQHSPSFWSHKSKPLDFAVQTVLNLIAKKDVEGLRDFQSQLSKASPSFNL
jgi:hypothetical protein